MKLYRRTIPQTRMNYFLRRRKNKNVLLRKKDANNEVKYDVPNYFNVFNVFECGRKLLDRLDVSYERAYVATPKEEYSMEMLDHLNEYNDHHGQKLPNKKLRDAVIRVTEEEEEEIKSHINNITIDTSFQSPVAMNAKKKDANMSLEIRLTSGVLAKTIKNSKVCTIQSTINDSGYYESNKQVDEIKDSEEQVDARN